LEEPYSLVRDKHGFPSIVGYADQWWSRLCAVVAFQSGTDIFSLAPYSGIADVGERFYESLGAGSAGERGDLDWVALCGVGLVGEVGVKM